MSTVNTLRDLMTTLSVFALVAELDVLLWEASLGEIEVLVAQFPDGTISATRAFGCTSAITVGCTKYPSPGARPPPATTFPSFFPTSM